MPIPSCSNDCDDQLPEVKFDECAPEVNEAQIQKIYLTNKGNPLINVTDLVEWNARLDNSGVAANAIRTLHVIASKPKPSSTEKEISLGRTVNSNKSHSVPFKIDETNQINHDFTRQMECNGQYLMWYETSGGLLFGGNEGIPVSIVLDMVIAESTDEFLVYEGEAKWKAKFTEERALSPLA